MPSLVLFRDPGNLHSVDGGRATKLQADQRGHSGKEKAAPHSPEILLPLFPPPLFLGKSPDWPAR